MLDTIRKLYREGGLDAVWRWAMRGKNAAVRAKRFHACAEFARKHRDEQKKGSEGYKLWEGRRGVYHRKAVHFSEIARKRRRRKQQQESCTAPGDPCWGGCRAATDKAEDVVGGAAPTTSRKRWATFGNPGSDHHMSQLLADAINFGIANAFALRDKVMRAFGVTGAIRDYGHYYVVVDGVRMRLQPIAGTHGTGPHFHFGARR